MWRIIERNLLRTFKKIYSISDTYNSRLIFRKVGAIYSAKQTNDTDQRAGEILSRCTLNHGFRTAWELGRDVNTVQVRGPTACSCLPALQQTCERGTLCGNMTYSSRRTAQKVRKTFSINLQRKITRNLFKAFVGTAQ